MHDKKEIDINGKLIEIDCGCTDLVLLFNSLGLTTKFCCEGDDKNPFSIMFEDTVTDKQIEEFLLKTKSKYGHSNLPFKLSKWCRVIKNEIKYNWMFTAHTFFHADASYTNIINSLIKENSDENK